MPDQAATDFSDLLGRLLVHRLDTGALVAKHVHPTTVNCLEFSPDGALLATGWEDARVHVHSADGWERRHELAHDLPVWAMAFAPDSGTLAVGTNRGAVTLWALHGS
ncbi:hypothetical protein AB0B78_01205 [Streptomyces sp. NPDC040724]|uniref:WD40 repeat domain-containing protein n=1 Tax=Streptomyces sp. NPDC040724 TaxID=3155612 RepID=UPI0033E39606